MLNEIMNVVDECTDMVEDYLYEHGELVSAAKLGLDPRCGSAYVTDEAVVVQGGVGRFDYYGGFEYVESEYRSVVGHYTIFTIDDERIRKCIDHYNEEKDDTEDSE